MMFWYGGHWAFWQAGLMWAGMIVFWGLLIWGVYALIKMRAAGQAPTTTAMRRGAFWTGGWPAARSTPRSTAGSAA
jgi:hypothetical protein